MIGLFVSQFPFPISGLVRLGVKPRLCRSSWRAFASTHSLMLPSTCSREALLACPPFPPWNLSSFTVESTLPTPCSCSDPPLSRQDAALAHLDSLPIHDLVLWTEGSVPFRFGKSGSGALANCFLCGAGATLSFSAGPVRSSFSAEACAILRALFWLRHHQQACYFSSLYFSYLTLVVFLPPCPLLRFSFCLKLCGRSGRNRLLSPPILSGYNESPDTRFSRRTTRLMSWPDGKRYLRPPQPLVVSLLLSLVSTLVFFRTGGVLSHRSSSTRRFPRFPTRNVCSLVTVAVFSLVYAATDTVFANYLFFYYWQDRESFLERLWALVPGHLSSHSALSRNGLFAPLALWQLLVSVRPLGLCGLPPRPHPSEEIGYTTTTTTTRIKKFNILLILVTLVKYLRH